MLLIIQKQGEFETALFSQIKKGEFETTIFFHTQRRRILSEEKSVSPDTVLKNYWSGNEEFADLFNAVLFGGSQIIRADELENEDTEDSVVLEQRKQAEGVKAARDNVKIMKKDRPFDASSHDRDLLW